MKISAYIAALGLCLAVEAFGQTAQITGRFTDTTDAVIPDAQVTVTNIETGFRRNTSSNSTGYYSVPLLPKGEYKVMARKDGFRPVSRSGILLSEGQTVRLDFVLEVGQVTENVEVKGETPLLDSSTPAVSTVVSSERIVDLPLFGRNPVVLATLVPGVRMMGAFDDLPVSSYSGAIAAIAGGPPTANNIMVDGTAAENFTSGNPTIYLSADATSEFRIITRNPSAEYGRTGGGVINVVSKSGTNQLHGTVYEFLRNRSLNANDFFSNRQGATRTPLVFNNYGFTVGGPLRRNRTFYFVNWEQFKERTQGRVFRTVPTALERQGDFSQTRTSAGQLIQIFDQTTTRGSSATGWVRDLFPGNVVPASRISAVSKAVLGYYPLPNTAGVGASDANNFYGQSANARDNNTYGVKLDHDFSSAIRLNGRYTYGKVSIYYPNYFNNIADNQMSDQFMVRRSIALTLNWVLRPSLMLESRGGFNRYAPYRPTRSYGFDVGTLGLPASLNSLIQVPQFPNFAITDFTTIGPDGGDHLVQANNTYSGYSALTWVRGAHTVKAGTEYRVYQNNNTQGSNVMDFAFSRVFTQGPNPNVASAAAGYGLATFLLGLPTSGQVHRWTPITYQARNLAAFLQDDWKVTPRLTLNLGLRWDYEGAVTDRFDAISNFDPYVQTSTAGLNLRGGLVYPGVNGLTRGMRNTSLTDFDPRFGFAYQLLRRTAIRGGFGVYHLPQTGHFVSIGRTGYDIYTSMVSTSDGGLTAVGSLGNPYPKGVLMPPGRSQGALTGIGTSVMGNLRSMRRGYTNQWNISVQEQLKSWLIELAYMGNHGVALPANRNFYYLTSDVLAMGTALQQQVPNPYAGMVTTGNLSTQNIARSMLLETYPQYLGVTGLDSWACSIYHALGVRAEKRMGRGFTALLSYTYSKLLDNNVGAGTDAFSAGGSNGVQNWNNLAAERAVSTSHLPHRLSFTASYVVPSRKTWNRTLRTAAGGWQLNTILSMQSGDPIAITAPAPSFGGSRPNVVGDPNEVDRNIYQWFNKSAFQTIAPFTFGNGPRNLPRTRTDATRTVNLSIFREFKPVERFRLQYRAEFFNLTNTPVFGAPGSTFTSSTFGVISSQANSPRRVQMALKLVF